MSNSRGGFFSLNRLLGRKQKNEKNLTNNLSKSSTLTRSTTNLEEISPQNKIAPLVVIPNAPFEQSFRITVYLPFGQLYVARIGAKTKLSDLLDTICVNKSLDPNKFEFKHPADDAQTFDLNFTVGEVGLNEIKLVPKCNRDDTSVKYRQHSNNHENRLTIRPHTMSSVSPYSSTNSLNSSDSSGIVMNQRLNNSNMPAAPNRKKRFAPRPPSQNSIPENPEMKYNLEHTTFRNNAIIETSRNRSKYSNLFHQHFHVSSPNLSANNNTQMPNSNSNTNTSETVNDFKKNFGIDESTLMHNHSRTSSETSDITRDSNFPEPQPRKRPPISKKKAPAPPPRTISSISNSTPIANPRNMLQKLTEENSKNILPDSGESHLDNDSNILPVKNSVNVSKVMLNENKTQKIHTRNDETGSSDDAWNQISGDNLKMIINDNSNVSKTQITYEKTFNSHNYRSNGQKLHSPLMNHAIDVDHEAIFKQVNEIIDEAAEINESKLNDMNSPKHGENIEECVEINNNDRKCNQNDCEPVVSKPNTETYESQAHSDEIPIEPILNETRKFKFYENNDYSLPTSTTSTLNTTEMPTTGPESLITSDIEDGYKGNELENKRNIENIYQDSKEEFIESQFEFLREHSDNQTYDIETDDDKTFNFNKKCNIISSTMIADKFNETYKISPLLDKMDVISELTQIINGKRLDTFIKPNNESDSLIEQNKRSTLSNFQISTYTNLCHETQKSKTNGDHANGNQMNIVENPNQSNIKQYYHTVPLDAAKDTDSNKSFTINKEIGRSFSFQSSHPINLNEENNSAASNIQSNLSTTRSNSFLSLNDISNTETHTNHMECSLATSRKKCASELSISDTPSLQSIEIMKSILNKSKISSNSSANIETIEKYQTNAINQRECGENVEKMMPTNTNELELNKLQKTYKYHGPPAINLSTWGERPKSMVHIKSDTDYIFGSISKVETLQKHFNGIENANCNDDEKKTLQSIRNNTFKSEKMQCVNNSCKLPIVRGVEYKKNITNNRIVVEDLPDSTSFRPRYEVSCLVSDKSVSENVKPLLRSSNNTMGQVKRFQSFNGQEAKEKITMKNPEKPHFTQFKLRKTGLKEKMFNDCYTASNLTNDNTIHTNNLSQAKTNQDLKSIRNPNAIPKAPKPPPIQKKPNVRPISMDDVQSDPRNQLLDSIRNFNRDTLKRKVIF